MKRIGTLLGWAAALALFASQLWPFRTFFIDDAFITFRYVRQFVAGNGLVYNIGERVEGYSNFLWIMLLALPHAFGAELITTARVLSVILSVGSLILTYGLARSAGVGTATWNGRTDTGIAVPPGTYQVQIIATGDEGEVARVTRPLVVIR